MPVLVGLVKVYRTAVVQNSHIARSEIYNIICIIRAGGAVGTAY